MKTDTEKREELEQEIYEYRKAERVELDRLVARFEPTGAWKERRLLGTLLNNLEEYSVQVNTFFNTRDYLQAADSMLDVKKTATEILEFLASNNNGQEPARTPAPSSSK